MTPFVNLLTSSVICKQKLLHKNEIVQYLQIANATTLVKTILESLYKVPQSSQEGTIFERPVQFSNAA